MMVRDRETYMDTLHDSPQSLAERGEDRNMRLDMLPGEERRNMRSELSQKIGISMVELNELIPVICSSTAWLSIPPPQ
jgi:hypothetical protein